MSPATLTANLDILSLEFDQKQLLNVFRPLGERIFFFLNQQKLVSTKGEERLSLKFRVPQRVR